MASAAVDQQWQDLKTHAEALFKAEDFAGAAHGYGAALAALSRQAKAAPDDAAKLRANRCAALQRLGDWDAAIEDAEAACRLAPDWEKGWYRLGTAYLGKGGCAAEARAAFERGLQLKPHNRQLKEGLVKSRSAEAGAPASERSAAAENRAPAAAAAASPPGAATPGSPGSGGPSPPTQQASQDLPAVSSAVSLDMGSAPLGSGATLGSPRVLAEAQKALGNAAYAAGRWDEAARCFTAALELAPGVAVYWGNRAAARLMARGFADAAADSLKAVELDPSYIKGYARAAKAEMLQGRWERAESLYKQGVERGAAGLQNELVQCQIVARKVWAGQEALRAGEPDRALTLAEAACAGSVPPAEPAVKLKVEALLALGRHAEAVAEARGLTAGGDASAPEVLALRARALYLSGNLQFAQQLYQQALRRDPDCVPAQRGLKTLRGVLNGKERGNAAFSLGAYQEAAAHYTASLEADPSLRTQFVAQVVCNRAACALKLGRPQDGLADAERAIELDAGYAKAYVRRAQAHQELKSYEAAIRDFEHVATLDDAYPGLREMLREAKLALKKSKRVDYYAVLGVAQDAGEDELKKAYRKAALRTHPDKASEEEREAAEVEFKAVQEAWGVLSDPAQRQRYNAGWDLAEINQGYSEDGGRMCGFGGGFGGMDEDDLFAHMFASRMGGGFGGGPPRRPPGGGGFPGGYGGGGGYGYHYG